MNDVILGTIVGASAAILGSIISSIFTEIFKNRLQINRENRESLRNGCEDAKKLLFKAINSPAQLDLDLVMITKVKLSLYATNDISIYFNEIINNILIKKDCSEMIENFNKVIKKSLKIKN